MEGKGHRPYLAPIPYPTAPVDCEVTDAVVCAVAKHRHGSFTPEQKAEVRAVLEAAAECGRFVWIDAVYVEQGIAS